MKKVSLIVNLAASAVALLSLLFLPMVSIKDTSLSLFRYANMLSEFGAGGKAMLCYLLFLVVILSCCLSATFAAISGIPYLDFINKNIVEKGQAPGANIALRALSDKVVLSFFLFVLPVLAIVLFFATGILDGSTFAANMTMLCLFAMAGSACKINDKLELPRFK